ncbi:MAG: glutaminase [Caulobacteraceae bacterium]
MKPAQDLSGILAAVQGDMQAHLGHGKPADYIPALARVDPRHFGMAAMTVDGEIAAVGDADIPFSIQSISKVFTLTMALEKMGSELWTRVGREPSGSRFNSMVRLEQEHGIPRNPLINAGAIVVCDVLLGQGGLPNAAIGRITDFLRELAADPEVSVDMEVAQSEADTGFRNASLANFLKASGNLHGKVEEVLDVYFHQCALAMNCRQLVRAGPLSRRRRPRSPDGKADHHRRAGAADQCGDDDLRHYDASGEFAFRVGLPGKSGVGGGILAVAPGKGAVAVWSPGLNPAGTSHVGALALERFAALAAGRCSSGLRKWGGPAFRPEPAPMQNPLLV